MPVVKKYKGLGTFATLDEYLAYSWYRTSGIDRGTKAKTQANARKIQPGRGYRAKMQVRTAMIGLTVKSVDCYFAPVRQEHETQQSGRFPSSAWVLKTAAAACKNNLQCRR